MALPQPELSLVLSGSVKGFCWKLGPFPGCPTKPSIYSTLAPSSGAQSNACPLALSAGTKKQAKFVLPKLSVEDSDWGCAENDPEVLLLSRLQHGLLASLTASTSVVRTQGKGHSPWEASLWTGGAPPLPSCTQATEPPTSGKGTSGSCPGPPPGGVLTAPPWLSHRGWGLVFASRAVIQAP